MFLDGVGIGPDDPSINPFFAARLPALRESLGGRIPSLDTPVIRGPRGRTFPVDACLGVDGTPQSGTGQIALFTGRNAPRLFGKHFGPWPPVRLRPLLLEENFLRRTVEMGHRVVFANAYPPGYPGDRSARRVAVPPLAAESASALDRSHEDLATGRAVSSEIVNDAWRAHVGPSVPRIGAAEAGANLARIHEQADLTVFAHYSTDFVGHRGGAGEAAAALETVDAFLGAVVRALPDDTLLLVASDHGNIEELTRGHTRNPVLGCAFGAAADRLDPPELLTDFSDVVLGALEAC